MSALKEITPLQIHPDSPLTEIWPDVLYDAIMSQRVNSIVQKILGGTIVESNQISIFSKDSGLPLKVAFPRMEYAKRLAKDYSEWIANLQLQVEDPDALIKTYTFKFRAEPSTEVWTFEPKPQRIATGAVLFSYNTAARASMFQKR